MQIKAFLILAVVALVAAKPAKVGSAKQDAAAAVPVAVVPLAVAPAVKPTTSDTLSVDDILGLVVGEDDEADDAEADDAEADDAEADDDDDDDVFPLLGGDLFEGLFDDGVTQKPKPKPVAAVAPVVAAVVPAAVVPSAVKAAAVKTPVVDVPKVVAEVVPSETETDVQADAEN